MKGKISKSLLIVTFIIPLCAIAQDKSILNLERLFSSREFRSQRFGPARWLENGAFGAATHVETIGCWI